MFNKKGMIIPTLGTVFIVVIIIFLMILGRYSSSKEGGIVQEGGRAISLANNVEFWKKSLDESIQIISKRTAYDLGKAGGIRGFSTFYWKTDYPKLPDLIKQYEMELKNRLPSTVKGNIEVSWSYPYPYVKILWDLPGDCDFDGDVDNDDRNNLTYSYNSTLGDMKWNPNCDFDWDEKIDIYDATIWSANSGKTGGKLKDEKNFFYVNYVNSSFYSKSTETKISVNQKINQTVTSSYFKLLYIGRRILEDNKYSSKLIADRAGLVSDLKNDFGISSSITLATDYVNVSLTDDNCSSSGESYCLAPLTSREGEILFSGKIIPYNYISLNYLVKIESIPCISCDAWVNGTCGAGGCNPVTQRQQTRTGIPEDCTICPDGLGFSGCIADPVCSICTSCSSWTNSGNCGASGCSSEERPQTRTGSPFGCTQCPDGGVFSRCFADPMCSICQCSDGTPCGECSDTKPKYCTASKTLINGCGAPYNCNCSQATDICNSDGTCSPCIPKTCSALGKKCGSWPDGCGNTLSCGSCILPEKCVDGICTCTPNCAGKECGPDGCGGSCGTCPSMKYCIGGNCIDCICNWNEQYRCGGLGCTIFVFWSGWWSRCECNVPGCGTALGIGCNSNSEYDMYCTSNVCGCISDSDCCESLNGPCSTSRSKCYGGVCFCSDTDTSYALCPT